MTDTAERLLHESLSELERDLLYGRAKGWGSWMFMVANDLVAKGLARKEGGSIHIDTPLAKALIARARAHQGQPTGEKP